MNWEKIAKARGEDIVALTATVESKRELIKSLVDKLTWQDARMRELPYGQLVLAHLPDKRFLVAALHCGQDQYQDEYWVSAEGTPIPEPTHWMPLPGHPPGHE